MSWRKTGKKGYPVGKGLKVEGSAAEGDSATRNRPQFPTSSTLQICRVIIKGCKGMGADGKGFGRTGGQSPCQG